MKINTNNANISITVGNSRQFPKDPRPEVALSGRSNVGKSSLINTLLGRKSLARVSSSPGKTITINYYDIDKKLYLVDLPGYGYAKRSQESKKGWSSLTEDYFVKNPSSDSIKLVIQLIDIRTGPTDDDILICAHSDDALDRPLSTYNYASLRIIHIEKAIAYIGGEETFKDLIEGISLPTPPIAES